MEKKIAWFEVLILFTIFMVGVSTGLELENDGRNKLVDDFAAVVSNVSLVVFTLEVILKLVAEGEKPWKYFFDKNNKYFNTFDFFSVLGSYAFLSTGGNSGAIGALRMLRLVRILTFIKNVPQLRVIIAGLVQGLKSVGVIVMLLFLIIYMFSILGCITFGENDPSHFGSVSIAMMTLFQVSTLASWTSIAYVSWYGCNNFEASPYGDHPSKIRTITGEFLGFKCESHDIRSPFTIALFFSFYILITSWVVMSLFIGVISSGMFNAFQSLKEEEKKLQTETRQDENSMEYLVDGEYRGSDKEKAKAAEYYNKVASTEEKEKLDEEAKPKLMALIDKVMVEDFGEDLTALSGFAKRLENLKPTALEITESH